MKKNFLVTILIILALSMWSQVFAVAGVLGDSGLDGDFSELNPVVGGFLGVFQWVGYAIAVGALIYLGIKYVLSAADDKATLKGAAWKYILGAFLISGAATVVGFIFN